MKISRPTLIFYGALLASSVRASLYDRRAWAVQAGLMLLNNLIFFSMWWFFFSKVDHLAGWHLRDVATQFGIVTGAWGLCMVLCGGVHSIASAIYERSLDGMLVRPASPLVQLLLRDSWASGWGDVCTAVVFLATCGYVGWQDIPLACSVILCSAMVLLATGILWHSLAFWIPAASALAHPLFDFMLTFSIYPQHMFQGVLKILLVSVFPASWVGLWPTEALRYPGWGRWLICVGSASLYVTLAWAVFHVGLRRYRRG